MRAKASSGRWKAFASSKFQVSSFRFQVSGKSRICELENFSFFEHELSLIDH